MTELKLSKIIYEHENIKEAVDDFSTMAYFKVTEFDEYYLISISDSKYPEERTVKEFENYLIDLTYKRRK